MAFLSFAMVFLNSFRKSLAENKTWPTKELDLLANGVAIQPKSRVSNRRKGGIRTMA